MSLIDNLREMKREQCPYINNCEGNVLCIDGKYAQGIICLIKKHIECEKYKKIKEVPEVAK